MPNSMTRDHIGLWGLIGVQALCVFILIAEVGIELYGETGGKSADGQPIAPNSDHDHNFEFVVIVLLTGSLASTGLIVRRVLSRHKRTDELLQAATGAFFELVQQYFDDWDLTPSERDVALLSIKGLMISEIAQLRNTKLGTIKAQCASIYRKAGVSGRPQLLSLFLDELIAKGMSDCKKSCPQARSIGHNLP
ncbi:helix-turn-helix transcriptional regulator [Hoeflea sp. TYP-13]|uniref:helix-turn-helix transcriptional regulator n=1 Tax=Hoeflea sp. TYP-13 TaxID=3230023 RepID=UPI0034C5B739